MDLKLRVRAARVPRGTQLWNNRVPRGTRLRRLSPSEGLANVRGTVIEDPATGEKIPRPRAAGLSLRIDRDCLKVLRWWTLQLDGGVPLASIVRSVLEDLADEIIDNYDVENNSSGVTAEDLRARLYRKMRYRDRQGRVRYNRTANPSAGAPHVDV